MSGLLDVKLANLATKEDLGVVTNRVSVLEEENSRLKEQVGRLLRKDRRHSEKLLDLESRSRRNNLIFRGIKHVSTASSDYRKVIIDFCSQMFGTGPNLWVNRAHTIGWEGAIIAHIPNDDDIDKIMSQTKKLKGTGFVVHRDFPQEVRECRAKLMAVRTEVQRAVGNLRMPLVHDHLFVEGVKFFWKEGQLMAGRQDGVQKLQSMFKHDFSAFLAKLNGQDVVIQDQAVGLQEDDTGSRGVVHGSSQQQQPK